MDHLEAPAPSMLPPPQRDETVRYSKGEWEQHRPLIEGMYPLKGICLKAIIACLKEDRGFVVNERQLKRKIKDWKLEKNVKSGEMKVIVRKIQQRAAIGKNTAFRVRGQPVDPTKIERWQNRCGKVDLNNSPSPSSSPSTPSDISYNTIHDLRSPSPYGRNILAGGIDYEGAESPFPPLTSSSPVLGQINSMNVFGADVFSNQRGAELFEGRSPSPFTAPPSPASTLREITKAPSNLSRTSQNPVAGESLAVRDDVAQAMFQQPQSFQRKRYKQTEEIELIQRLDDFQSRYGISHPATIDTAIRLAGILRLQGRYQAAELLFKQGATCLHQNFGENDPRTVYAFSELALCHVHQGQLSKAEKLLGMVYLKASQIFHLSDRMFLVIKKSFGYCRLHLGDYVAAEQAYREVLATVSQFLPAKDLLLRVCMSELAMTLMCSSQLSEAEKLLSDVLEICAFCENVDVHEILAYRGIFARICYLQGKHHLAERKLREVRETQTLTLGREHDNTLRTTKQLAETLGDLGRVIEGEELLRDATKISTKILGEKHWRVSESVEEVSLHSCSLTIHPKNYAAFLPEQYARDIADFLFTQTLDLYAILAGLLCKQEKYVEAENIAVQVLGRCGDVFGSNKFRTRCLAAMVLSSSCHAQGRLKEALEATKMASESNARTQVPEYEVIKECERRIRDITQEMVQLRKPGDEDFLRMKSPQRDLNEVAGRVDSDLDLLSNNRVSTFPNSWP